MKQDWETKKLGEICSIELGKTPYRGDESFWDKEKETRNVWLSIADLLNVNGNVVSDSKEYISDKATKLSKLVEKGTLLVSFKLTLGRLAFAGKDLYTNEAIAALVIKDKKIIDINYLYQFLSFFDWNLAAEGDVKVKGKTLNKAKLKEIEIIFPSSLKEQKRIVSILDRALADVEKAKANAEQNLKNAKELFESYLQGVFEKKGDDWEEKTLGDIGKPSMCKRILKHQTSSTGDIPFYKIGTFGKAPNAFISRDIYNEFRTKYSFPKKGDILISASGTIGRRVRYNGEPAFFQDSNIVWIDNDEKQVLNDYLYVFYEFCDWQPSKGATIARLYNSDLTRIKIVFPKSLAEQKNILKKIDALSAETKKLEAIYQQKIKDLEELKKSILQKAFNGEL
ncbi:MAG: restriction endonuclease subunit S [Candidatus Moraniibacteriota bacterium]|nr:MAG: restriction endonuclease subunit S [Candidatus Moranbacteria bacterium]